MAKTETPKIEKPKRRRSSVLIGQQNFQNKYLLHEINVNTNKS